jgi:DNA polymerase I-like protein with 3'-5' exonuclease and polymerase domains
MRSVVVDFETYYGDDYTLSKMTTEAYIRDPRFETILCGFKVGSKPGYWVDGCDVGKELEKLQLHNHAVVAHHAHFDGLILNHHYGVRPRMWIDTLSMARAIHGTKGGNSLAKLAERHGIGAKGHEVVLAKGKRRADFSHGELEAYGRYCVNDCALEYDLARILGKSFCQSELYLIDSFIRMFTEPVLRVRTEVLTEYLAELRALMTERLILSGATMGDLRSNQKFAEALAFMGIEPPLKISKTTGKWTYAFAKSDSQMQALAEHDDEAVQALIAARLGAKSTINETRALRLIDMAARGTACVYLNYYGAGVTGRASGGDKLNWQNFTRGSPLRTAIYAPPGMLCGVGDSSNIESRVEDWLAGQDDVVEAYRLYDAGLGPDIYCVIAGKIYGRLITKADNPIERQMGKVAKLGLGYGMGWEKFIFAAKSQGKVVIDPEEAQRIVHIYRSTHSEVVGFWNRCNEALGCIAEGEEGVKVDHRGIITTTKNGLLLPNGLEIKYPDLKRGLNDRGGLEWTYFDGKMRQKIYGGKVCENIVQALARIIVMEQCMMVGYQLRLSVHDEGVWVVPKAEAETAKAEIEKALRTPLPWCRDLPLNCEVGFHQSYGKAKK